MSSTEEWARRIVERIGNISNRSDIRECQEGQVKAICEGLEVRHAYIKSLESELALLRRVEEALRLLASDCEGYPAYERPCFAIDQARTALAALDTLRRGES